MNHLKHLCTTCTASALSGSCTDRIFRNRGNIDGYKTEGQSVIACPEYLEKQTTPNGWTKTEKGRLARQAWGVIRPDGSVLVDSHFKTEATAWQVILPKAAEIPEGLLVAHYEFGVSNSASDWDNGVKPFQDVLQKKYGFDDRRIFRAVVEKVKVKKGSEYIKFSFSPYLKEAS